jgi:hypothetical protein
MRLLYPVDFFDSARPDEIFAAEAAAFEAAGFDHSVIDLNALQGGGRAKIRPLLPAGETIVYRGWMLTPGDYSVLVEAISRSGAAPLTSVETYGSTHHLPNWYPRIRDLTPETAIFSPDEDLKARLRELAWDRFFIKDYVKSLKTSVGSTIERPEDIETVLSEMEKYRGQIEGGVCVRRVEPFVEGSERRYFVIAGKPFSSAAEEPTPEIVQTCAARIASPFFSVDVARREDGADRIVEVGDGQVSDLVGWEPERFAAVWQLAVGSPTHGHPR